MTLFLIVSTFLRGRYAAVVLWQHKMTDDLRQYFLKNVSIIWEHSKMQVLFPTANQMMVALCALGRKPPADSDTGNL